ncbi:TonB-dependent receptor [Psychrobium sp. 1_MG-2023]|uniref:TonB-dependent receptor n=1 Tax=Psychrobium sp. 1_MG-2023 TaxID=3062624 RepID=UPI000C34A6C8|nr:TonB-dependent receptor [Psychrobium sp. 1_MG-2023]MDP2560131.1 TonB-dependent receptor [Psychrobium sp. 1_MG-2023]PKF56944.1 TonB-dependent receptor [Alteromonadales bacterium alter-6D02]
MKPALSLLTLAILATPVFAEQNKDIEVIEVTSNFRQANLMKTEGSISVIGAQQIAEKNALHSEQLLGAMANVNFSSGASRGNFVQIRGIGLRSQFVDPVNPSVGLIIDGINYSGLGGAAMLFDIDSYALYRGPQGTQFGNDALAGVIKLDSTPAGDHDNRVMFGYGNYNTIRTGVAVGTEVTDSVGVRVSAVKQTSDGYITNDFLKTDDTNNIDESNVKLKLNWKATEDLTIDTVMHYIDVDNGYDAFSLDFNRHTLSDEPGRDAQRTKAFGVSALYTGLAQTHVELSVSTLDSDIHYGYDEDWTYDGIHDWGYSSTDTYLRDRGQDTLELRFLSDGKTLFDNKASWVAGVYLNQRDSGLVRQYTWQDQDFTSQNDHQDVAVYGQIAYDLSEKTTLTVGARVSEYDIDYNDNAGVKESVSDNLYGFNISINNQVNEQAMTYLTLARSEKAGGINGVALAKKDDIESPELRDQLLANSSFDPETLYSAEFGVKGRSLDNDLNIKLAAFYHYRQNPQLKGWVTDKVDGEAETFIGYIDNAGGGRGYGIELETRYNANDNLELYYNIGYLMTRIKDYVIAQEEGDDRNMHNREMAHAPEYQFNAGLNYQSDNGFYAGAELAGKDSFYFSDSHDEQSNSYVLTNVHVGYQGESWKINLTGHNIFDKDYSVRGFYFGNDPRDGYEAHNYVQFGEPQTVNLSVEVNW